MSSTDPSQQLSLVTHVAAWVRRWLVGLLAATYVLAGLLPSPGLWLAGLGNGDSPAPIRFSLVMVGVLLVCGASSIDLTKLRALARQPGAIGLSLLGVWGPAIAVVAVCGSAASYLLPAEEAAALAVGLALAGAMPVANSAVAWTHQSGGAVAWALGLVVLTIALCPWVTPMLLSMMGHALGSTDSATSQLLVSKFTGVVFLVWVLGPTLLGLAARLIAGGERIDRWRPFTTLASATSLLLLNYANASRAIPQIVAEPNAALLATVVAAAAVLPMMGAIASIPLTRASKMPATDRTAIAYSLAMKNTGLALGLAGATLGGQPVVILVILAVTLTQHAVAGAIHAFLGGQAD